MPSRTRPGSLNAVRVASLLATLIALALAAASTMAPAAAQARTFVVDDERDKPDSDTDDGRCETEDHTCTLRAAIQQANREDDRDTITFDLPDDATIEPEGNGLPAIRKPVTIDGAGDDGRPHTVIGGDALTRPNAPSGEGWFVLEPHGLQVTDAQDVVIRGLIVNHTVGAGIAVVGGTDVRVENNWFGLDRTGTFDAGYYTTDNVDPAGVLVRGGRHVTIGGPLAGQGNVISGTERGVVVVDGALQTSIEGNLVGLSADGREPIRNDRDGIVVALGLVGTAPRETEIINNVVSSSGRPSLPELAGTANGIHLQGAVDTRIVGNWVGYDRSHEHVAGAEGGTLGVDGMGIRVEDAPRTTIGGRGAEANHVAASKRDAILVIGDGLSGTRVQGNVVGLDAEGRTTVDADLEDTTNAGNGIRVLAHETASDVLIGGDALGEGNTVAGSREQYGMIVEGPLVAPRIVGNTVGTSLLEPTAIPDKLGGILVDRSDEGRPSDPLLVGNRVVAEPVGIRLEAADRARVRGNRVGLGADGRAIGNGYGIAILDAPDAEVGGPLPEDANTIVAARQAGVVVNDARAAGTRIFNNDIGRTALPSTATPDELGNAIGVAVGDAAGRQPAKDVTVGGTSPGTANRIANGDVGVLVRNQARHTTVAGNVIGLDGTAPAPMRTGIEVSRGPETQVGLPGRPNVVVATTADAILVSGTAEKRRVQGNRLGLPPAPGTEVIGNRDNAIRLSGASEVVVGYGLDAQAIEPDCVAACNEIAGSDGSSIVVTGEGTKNTIRGNRVRVSGGLAVDLGNDGLDQLDERDADGGPNRGMNAPAALQVVRSGRRGNMVVTGLVESAKPTEITVDIYRQPMPSEGAGRDGVGQDTTWVGTVKPDAHGAFVAAPDADHTGKDTMYTAIATDKDGNSSEFGQACGAVDPSLGSDGDGDGICDEWERWGVDVNLDGIEDFDFPDARTKQRDAYVEVDAMEGPDLRPSRASLARVQRALSDGPGGGVVLHFVTGDGDRDHVDEDVPASPGALAVNYRKGGALDDYDDYRWGDGPPTDKACPGYFGTAAERANGDHACWARMAARGLVVRYALAAHQLERATQEGGTTLGQAAYGRGFAEAIGAQTDRWALGHGLGREGCATGSSCREMVRSWTFMHELGHTFGLHHSGAENEPVYDPAHLSVMSYQYDMPNVGTPLDYGRGDGPAVIDEQAVDEQHGFAIPATATARGWKVAASTVVDPFGRDEPRDYVCDIQLFGSGEPHDFNLDKKLEPRIAHGLNDPWSDTRCRDDADKQTDRSTGDYDEWGHLELSVLLAERHWRPNGLRAAAADDPEPEPAHETLRLDRDGDGISVGDVCPTVPDRDQKDSDHDGVGDACTKPEIIGASDLAVKLDGPSRLRAGERGTLKVTLTNDWPIAAGAATVGLTLPEGIVLDGAAEGDGDFDAATARWSVDGVGVRGERRLTVPVRAEHGDVTAVEREAIAEVVAAADPDIDSTAGNGVPGEDDWAAHPIELLPGDAAPRALSVADAATAEGTTVARRLRFAITLDQESVGTVRLRARTRPGTATSPEDFDAVDVPVRFAPGQVRQVVEVPVRPDADQEDDEDLELELTDVDGATVARGVARGTIRDDDQPLVAGDLTALSCIGPYSDTKACGIEGPGLRGAKLMLMIGERDLYVSDREQLLLLHRDPATEAIEPVRCWAVFIKDRDCARLAMPAEEDEETDPPTLRNAETRRIAASADGRVIALSSNHGNSTGQDPRVQLLRRDPATGDLRYTGCIAPAGAPECLRAIVGYPDAVHVSPDGRFVYLVAGLRVRRIAVSADGVPTAITEQRFDNSEEEPQRDSSSSALAPDGRTLLVRAAGRLTVFDVAPAGGAPSIARAVDLPGFGPVTIAPDGKRAYAFSEEQRLLGQYGYPSLAGQGCAQERGTGNAGCAARPALLRGIGELAATADGRDVYGSVSGGGAIVVHRDGDGALKAGRCIDPEDDVPSCDEPGDDKDRRGDGVLSTADGRVVFTVDGGIANQLVRVQPPAPDGNRAPVCAPANVFGRPDSPLRVPLRCADFDGDPVTIRVTGDPAHGAFDPFDADSRSVTYHPERGFRGTDTATFRGSDGRAESPDTRIDLAVGNHAPMCASATLFVHSTRGTGHVYASCVDEDRDPLTVTVLEGPEHGTLGAFDGLDASYTPHRGYHGPDRITVRASDPYDISEPVTISIDVGDPPPSCGPAAPLALGAQATKTVGLACADPDGGPVTLAVESGVPFATATVKDGGLTVTSAEQAGSGTVVVAATDDGGQVARVEVPVTVTIPPPPKQTPADPTCANGCRPDAGGTVTITFFCDGASVSQAKYHACRGQAVMVVCSSPSACRTTTSSPTGHSAAAKGKSKAKVKILPSVKGKRLAQVRTSVKAGKQGRLRLKLTKEGRKQLARKRQLRVAIVIEVRQLDGKTSRVRKVVTIKAPKNKKARHGRALS
ncbi:MAG TPA: Ig-like domain-containing protein [Baekduia sp.]|uniref:Ig-like domain-containing protein n=1 Tax=Baekduia sp. TaxID=2600305 RepID=UPI002D78F096|nr:Ig-like domain-containing protein [Baekduia sp.]HET6505302.1 Ig-like domain-containing protein [Baekduia sp.]